MKVLQNQTDKDTQYSMCNSGDVRLVGGATNASGVVEVCRNNVWGTMCSNYFGTSDARVVCRQLGFQDGYGELSGNCCIEKLLVNGLHIHCPL